MKKIAITGHTWGIGRAIFSYFRKDPTNIVIGFSRSNGFDISDSSKRQEIIKQSIDCDIFVNNANVEDDDSQLYMLEEMFNCWEGQNKTIINISSICGTTELVEDPLSRYAIGKGKLDNYCFSKLYKNPYIMNLRPGLVKVEKFSAEFGENLHRPISTKKFIEIMELCLNSNLRIPSITFHGIDI
jgi:NADP-dependent 3-hydroxy acid dehydrogenase YdfG